jgi:hypothetical protein
MIYKTALAVTLLFPFSTLAQDADKKEDPATGAGNSAAFEAGMAEYMKLIEPGPMHAELAKQVGEWDMVQTFIIPGAPEMVAKGSTVTKAIHGGRYFVSDIKSTSAMGDYEGTGTSAYDTFSKKFVYTWIDSMATGVMVSYGKMKDDGSIEYTSEAQPDPMTGGEVVFRMVHKTLSKDKMTFDMWTTAVGSTEETKMMSVVYTRKK